jgi:hypothetical protein
VYENGAKLSAFRRNGNQALERRKQALLFLKKKKQKNFCEFWPSVL